MKSKTKKVFRTPSAAKGAFSDTQAALTSVREPEPPRQPNEQVSARPLFEIEEIYQRAPVGLSILDTELRWVRINEYLAQINGFPVAAHIGRQIRELLPELADRVEAPMRQVLASGQPRHGIEIDLEPAAESGVKRYLRESWLPIRDRAGRIIGLNVVAEEITREKEIEARLLWNKQCAELLSELAGKLLVSARPEEIIKASCLKVMRFLGCQLFFNYLVDDGRQQLHLNAYAGIIKNLARKIEWLDYGTSICGCVVRDGGRIIVEKIQSTTNPHAKLIKSLGIRAFACHPLQEQNGIIGTLAFGTNTRDTFTPDELDMMKAVANQVAVALGRIRTEEALRQSEEKYRGIIETANEGIWTLDRGGNVTFVNQRITEMLGYSSLEMLGHCALEFFPAEMPVAGESLFEEAMLRPSRFTAIPCRHKNGNILWVNISCSPICNKEGQSVGLFGMFTDISDHMRIAEELREHTQRFELVVAGTHAAIWDWDIRNNRVHYSLQWKLLRGFAENEIGDEKEEWSSRIHPADSARVAEAVRRHLEGITPFFADEYRVRCKDGSYKWIYDYGIAQRNDNEEVVRMAGSNTDITERKLAEKKKDRENRIMSLANRILEVFVKETGDGMYQKVLDIVLGGTESRYGVFGYINENGDLLCPTMLNVFGICSMENKSIRFRQIEWKEQWSRALLQGETFYSNEPSPVPFGHIPVQRNLVAPIIFHNTTIGLLHLANKETDYREDDREFVETIAAKIAPVLYAWIQRALREKERQQAERALRASEQRFRVLAEELREADRHKNEFLAVLSHELRNPLTPIKNSLFILERTAADPERVKRAKEIIERQVGQLARLVDDLLDVTRITRNRIELQCERLELNQLIRRTSEDHRMLFEKNNVRLECRLFPDKIFIEGDEARLAQVVGNLLQNAVKFTGQNGSTRIAVSVETEPETVAAESPLKWALIRVTDTGIGMTAEIISRLFQPFMQADKTLDRSHGGLGLGLALSKGIIELHGGVICARSDGPGRGSEFIIRLPLEEKTATEVFRGPVNLPPLPSRRILIIDDNSDIVESLKELLLIGGHQVKTAFSGPEGLALAKSFLPEVLLCDIGLPVMSGYDVAKAFRTNPALKDTLLIALSGYALPEDLEQAAAAGFDHHLAKPLRFPLLERILAGLHTGN